MVEGGRQCALIARSQGRSRPDTVRIAVICGNDDMRKRLDATIGV